MRIAPLALLSVLMLGSACGKGGGSSSPATLPTPTPSPAPAPAPSGPALTVDLSAGQGPIPGQLLGLNTPWQDLGNGIIQAGELVQDRSFRTLGGAGSAWLLQAGNGSVAASSTGGDPTPQGAWAYPGFARLVGGPGSTDLVGVSQVLLGPVTAGTSYTLCCSSLAEGPGAPALYAGLAVPSPFAALAPTQYASAQVGVWVHHRLSFTASQSASSAALYLGVVGPGTLDLDEVRFSALPDGVPTVDPTVLTRIRSLGSQVLCWPGGQLTDTFDWKSSIGTTLNRGEVQGLFGARQTPGLGLDEFLRLCEALGAQPLIQVNVNAPAADAADLVTYCTGPSSTVLGALRAANGHAAPYVLTRLELGNEPSATAYGGGNDAGSAYAALAGPVADALHAQQAGLQLSGAVEASFALADWRAADPLLINWTPEILPLAPKLAFLHGHYYSYYADDSTPALRFQRIMAGGTVLRQTQSALAASSALPLWITEHHLDVEQNSVIEPAYLLDAQSGLGVGEQLFSMMQGGFQGACVFNLAEPVGFGLLVHPGAWDFRPAGLAVQLLAPFAGETRLPASISLAPTLTLAAGEGNIPSNTTYPLVEVLASRQANGHLRLAFINRSYAQAIPVTLGQSGLATFTLYQPADLTANNETTAQVQLQTATQAVAVGDALPLPAHSLVRIDF